ncbi:hypothetical protein [Lysinibacillus sp. TE18511]
MLNKHAEIRKELVLAEKGDMYISIYANYLGDDFKLENSTSDDNEGIQQFIEALEKELVVPSVEQSA